jgi:flagellar FliJ protein
MAQFRFAYQSVLDHRRTMEDARQRELAMKLRQRMILQNELGAMQRTITESKHDMADALVGEVDLSEVSQFARFSSQTAQRAHAIVVKLAQGEKQIDEARQRLLEATRQRKAIDLLHDKHRHRWLREQEVRETAQLDDLAQQAYTRKVAAGIVE